MWLTRPLAERSTRTFLGVLFAALTFALMLAFFRNEMGFGGNNGLTDFRDILGFNLRTDATRLGLFLATGVMPDAWLFALGGLFVLVTVFLPKGIAGLVFKPKKAAAPANNSDSQEATV